MTFAPDNLQLFSLCLGFGFVSFLLLLRILSFPGALVVSTIKFAIPYIYFGSVEQKWVLLDDISYLEAGRELVEQGYNPFTIFFDPISNNHLAAVSGGRHVLYNWWNMLAVFVMGNYYCAPVLLNLFLTVIAAYVLSSVIAYLGFSRRYTRWFLTFFLLHWDILTWSSLINIKDILVMFLTTLLLTYGTFFFHSRARFRSLIVITFVCFLFLSIRLYIPVLYIGASACYLLTQTKFRQKRFFLFSFATIIFLLIPFGSGELSFLQPSYFFFGIFHFLLSPKPWEISPEYSFLTVAAIFHVLWFVPLAISIVILWRDYRYARFFIWYFIICLGFYAIFPEVNGPRHRIQLLPILALFQFHALWLFLQSLNGAVLKKT